VILLWGLPGDDPLDAVARALMARGTDFLLLDQRRALAQRIQLEIGATLAGSVWQDGARLELADVTSLYTRVYDARRFAHVAAAGADAWTRIQELETALWAWADETPARVVNRPTAMASNGSKPYQAGLIERAGFLVPETLVTTDPDAAGAFWERHGQVIYKSVSGVRSQVSRLGDGHRERLVDVVHCPTQFQAWVPGRDHRVHVVGDEVFAVEVVCDADDYRYASASGADCELRATTLPDEIAARARATAALLELPVAGIDLRRTPDGRWYCFEVNPSPCFTYYENHTGQPIAAALAAHLADARGPSKNGLDRP
jgi:glutathione synthase/RimK-type ligase-like ATP-grasp enzyme